MHTPSNSARQVQLARLGVFEALDLGESGRVKTEFLNCGVVWVSGNSQLTNRALASESPKDYKNSFKKKTEFISSNFLLHMW